MTDITRNTDREQSDQRLGQLLLFILPILMCSNMLAAKVGTDIIPPIAMAFWRWTIAFALMCLIAGRPIWQARHQILKEWKDLTILGALGMGICGAFVYLGAASTTATNIGLIYSASPVLIILLSRFFYGERMFGRQVAGVALGLAGVMIIIAKGSLQILAELQFTAGDLWIVAATTGWAVYSILLRHRPTELGLRTRFSGTILFGMLCLLPFTIWEGITIGTADLTWKTVLLISFVACLSSVAAYMMYAKVQLLLGASKAGLVLYLAPLYNSVLAYLLLGEKFEPHHIAGAALILPGLWLATKSPSKRK
ncbi:DMT family transporter [Aestuariispira insulae]|uniref:Drug/metabolite transporter (DMT)-like permease n=1 Tax=Aestuariispira insulae TaxID=1461337 RepID=A0A3D9HW12_9PROT|nr:DMT family transporter [Aestuariispira insulae]RED53657.1 drug/metabolite transporter (DMT)-like permease [Aestuariispira insulae]